MACEAETSLVDLTWSGDTGPTVEVQRDGTWVATSANDGSYTDVIDPRVAGSHVYEIFASESRQCSARVDVAFRP